jgi:glyoxylase-like metal-dependent hydrolase (beta-lactamase superfamily II)
MMFPAIDRSSYVSVDRRQFLAGASALIAAGLLPKNVLALAAPYTFKFGDLEISVVSDGHLVLPVSILAPDAPPEELKAILTTLGVTGDTFQPATNTTLIKAGNDLILFDTGSGTDFQPTAGKLKENLAAAGITPESITKVVFTHAHPDHVFGTAAGDGKLHFPNAVHYVVQGEWDFWMNPDLPGKMPETMRPIALGAQKNLGAIKDKVMVKPGDEITAGIQVIASVGHTPGHASFAVPGEGNGLIIMGDVIPNPAIYFPHPQWHFGFDADGDKAIETRKMMLDRAATDKAKLIGYHWTYPGLGFAERQGTGYRFVAAS